MQAAGTQKSGNNTLYSLRRSTCLAIIGVYPILHVAAVQLGLFLSSGSQTATLWTSNALLLAVMILLGRRWWLPLFGSLLIAEAFTIVFLIPHLPVSVGLLFSAANMSEALIAALLWQNLVSERVDIRRLRDCVVLVFIVAMAAPAIGGLLAGFGQVGLGDAAAFFRFWQLWWAADALGILVITTAILAWSGVSKDGWRLLRARRWELASLLGLVVGLAMWVFNSQPGSVSSVLGLPYVFYPLLIWGALRFGTPVSVAIVLLIAILAIIGTDSGYGPYAIPSYSVYQRVLSLQMFLAAAAITALVLGAAFSERGLALRVLRGSEDKFSKAFHASPDAICICRVSDGRIIDSNDSLGVLTGYSRKETINATLEELNFGPLEEQRRKYLELDRTVNQFRQVNATVVAKSGLVRECDIAFDVAMIEEEYCMVCVLHDLTEIRAEEEKRSALESELMQAKKMEAIGQLTGGIAHDFNNILFSILGNAELAQDHAARLKDSRLTKCLNEIHDGGTRARELVAQLLTFGRNKPSDPVPVDVAEAVDEVLRLLRQVLPSSLQINTRVQTEDIKVLADPVQLQQLIMNLCVNARDATDGNGTIDIFIDAVHDFHGHCSSCRRPIRGDFACLAIRDTGPGIEEEALAKIFEPFYTSKEVGKGTGLGLSVVHGVVHGHDGHIVVDVAPGKTRVSAYFPLTSMDAPDVISRPVETPRPTRAVSLNGKVLLVDDEEAVLNVMAQTLGRHGLDVTAVATGADAISRFEEDPQAFDLVITDQTMPHMTGVSLAKKVLAIRPDLPVMLCSGYSRDINADGARELGIRGYYQKPIEFQKLVEQISDLLGASPQ